MPFYTLLRPLLFKLQPETAHHIALTTLQLLYRTGLCKLLFRRPETSPKKILGLYFPNLVGLAAGLDKNGEYIDALAALGFGFIEIGTITPRPQPGNPKPRLFRLPAAQALINRLGFNNGGVDCLIENVKKAKFKGILGINIGKNFDSPLEKANEEYALCFSRVYPYASYVTLNISSPNTAGLRQLQHGEALSSLLSGLKKLQTELTAQHQKYVPLLVKIAPDLTIEEIHNTAQIILQQHIDGVIATNTTISRTELPAIPHANETGGLSGKPLFAKSLSVVQQLNQVLQGKIPIIACGGISSAEQAQAMFSAGASLVQMYTGLIYHGPAVIKECAQL